MKNPFLIGQKIYLRAPEDGDEQIIVLSENHPSPRETLFYAIPRSTASMKDRIRTMEDDPNSIVFSICNIKSNKVIGITALLRIDWVGRAAIFYIAISQKENWSHGYGSETTRLMIDYAFETFNLNRIQLHVFTKNTSAINVYKKCGFVIEGTLRQAMYRAGKYHDFYVMGLIRKDWKKNNTNP